MEIKRTIDGKEVIIKLTTDEVAQANTEFVTTFMYNKLIEDFGLSHKKAEELSVIAYEEYCEGDGLTEYECIEKVVEDEYRKTVVRATPEFGQVAENITHNENDDSLNEINIGRMRFDCNVNVKEVLHAINNHECYDSWGEVQYGDEQKAVDYNICIDNSTENTEYLSAFYKMYADKSGNWHHDDYSQWYSYNIDFSDADWEVKLQDAAKKAFEELWK